MRARLLAAALVATTLAAAPATWAAAPNRPRPDAQQHNDTSSVSGGSITVGTLRLHPCAVIKGAYCGHLDQPWEPWDPGAGTISVGFAYRPAADHDQPAIGTLVPHEGGPGYATTASGPSYAAMYGPLLDRRNLLLVDQRGTGRSEPIDCPDLQNLTIAYSVAAGRCSVSLGSHSADYSTPQSADDLAAVIEALELDPVDLYGDSYGTFFAEVFAGRHPRQLRSIVLDSAYPAYGESAWYPTQGPAMRNSFATVCERSPACGDAGPGFDTVIGKVLGEVRQHPWHGVSYDGDGTRMRVTVDAPNLAAIAFGATYGPYFYREFTAALRSGLRGDRVPLFRLVAQATGGGTDAGPARFYSEGLDAAVSCHDYPQLYDMTAAPQVRIRQYRDAFARRTRLWPNTYGPFTVGEYVRSDWEEQDWCLRWRSAPADNPAQPPKPPHRYPDVPTLVLSGEFDSITTPAEGALVASQFPRSRQIIVANSFHVTADGDTDDCAVRILRRFILAPDETPAHGCADEVPPVRAMGVFPQHVRDVAGGSGNGTLDERRIAPTAAATVADLMDGWWNNYSGHGVGLRGGRWNYTGDRTTVLHLMNVQLTEDLAVSGTATWQRYANQLSVDLQIRGAGRAGQLHGTWATRQSGARATLSGVLDGHPVKVRFPAP